MAVRRLMGQFVLSNVVLISFMACKLRNELSRSWPDCLDDETLSRPIRLSPLQRNDL